MRPIAICAWLTIAAAAGTSIAFVGAMKPTSTGAFLFFSAWLVLPHVAMAGALWFRGRQGAAPVHWHAVAILVCIGGVLAIADAIFWHPDAQGALAVLMVPLLQGVALSLLLPLAGWASRRTRLE